MSADRPYVSGKFIFVNNEKLYIRGVTYGPFRPDATGSEYHTSDVVAHDFTQMVANGINTVRVYTVPPLWLLDLALQHGLYVMVGIPWEQHVTFLDNGHARSIEERVRAAVCTCAGHSAILCYAIGNEIPAPLVRWYGRYRMGRFLKRLYRVVKTEDPQALVTYVTYPTTEYLQLPFIDFVAFNLYLEVPEHFEAYLARLQNLAGDRPLLLTEIGLDSRTNSADEQARVLDWQLHGTFAAGCVGAFVFAWTDEWHRGGQDIDDWDFGLTTRDRQPKAALVTVRNVFSAVPFPPSQPWPRISVVVCSYNGARTIADCCEGLQHVVYPDFEVLIVDDGSTDGTGEIAKQYGFQVISTVNRGLSSARNTGMQAASGTIVAYLDDDARPDPHWLTYLAATFMNTSHVGIGGPNLTPPGDGLVAECVANAPGNPTHILFSDQEAEHIPGCNMAFRKANLEAIGGFDPQFRVAGDDVDVCWHLQHRGWTLGFSPSATVWHHRRNSLRAYWKQQLGYGKAEALLERKWPDKYNLAGQPRWAGRVYGKGHTRPLGWRRERIYQGTWGSALFQSIHERSPNIFASFLMMPEWYLVVAVCILFAALGTLWRPMLLALPILLLSLGASVVQAVGSATLASFPSTPNSHITRFGLIGLTAVLHLLQPLARLYGRWRAGLTMWRWRGGHHYCLAFRRTTAIWTKQWRAPWERLQSIEAALRGECATVRRGSEYDGWDLEVQGGLLGSARLLMVVEEHGDGQQFLRFRTWMRCSTWAAVLTLALGTLSALATADRAPTGGAILGLLAALLGVRIVYELAIATGAVLYAFEKCTMTTDVVVHKLRRSRVGEL